MLPFLVLAIVRSTMYNKSSLLCPPARAARGVLKMEGNFRKTAFGGFKRQDVLQYIDGLSSEYTDEIELLNKEKGDLQNEISSLASEIASLAGDNEQLSARAELGDKAKAEAAETVARAEREVEILKEQNRQLTEKIAVLEERCARFEEASIEIGKAAIYAENMAKDIIAAATAEADRIKAEADGVKSAAYKGAADFGNTLEGAKSEFNAAVITAQNAVNAMLSAVYAATAPDDQMAIIPNEPTDM